MNEQQLSPKSEPRILPDFRLADDYLFCDEIPLDLRRRPLTKKLLAAFLSRPDQFLSRQDLVDVVYENFGPETRSRRFNEALKQNITKMVSRARALGEQTFNRNRQPWIEMFVYIPEEEGWCLFRLKNEYIARQEQGFRRELSPFVADSLHTLDPVDRPGSEWKKTGQSLVA